MASEFGPGFKDPLGRERQKDLIPFLMDLISLLIGGQRLEQMLTNLIGSQIEEIDKSIRVNYTKGIVEEKGWVTPHILRDAE